MYGGPHLVLADLLTEMHAGLVMELMEAGSLHDIIAREQYLREFPCSV